MIACCAACFTPDRRRHCRLRNPVGDTGIDIDTVLNERLCASPRRHGFPVGHGRHNVPSISLPAEIDDPASACNL